MRERRSAPPSGDRRRRAGAGLARRAGAAVALVAFTGAPSAPGVAETAVTPGPIPAPADTVADRLEGRLPELMASAEIPGLSAALIRDGEVVWTGAYGVRSFESGSPVDERTVFQAASLSKPVFAYAVMRLVDRGVLGLDVPLADYLPNRRLEHDARHRRITARMVLSHSTGLPNWGDDRLELRFDPGTAFGYSGEGYVYLQRVVEELTGLPLDDLVRREVFGPLGMDRSAYVWNERFEGDVALGHDAVGRPNDPPTTAEANAAASLLTTARDYGRFVAAALAGVGLTPETRRAMVRPELRAEVPHASAEENARIFWALGWGVHAASGNRSLWHWGDNGDHKAFVAAFPERETAFVYFANSTHGLAVAEEVARIVSGEHHWGPGWAGYEPHDHPVRRARRALFHAFVGSGRVAGLDALDSLRRRSPSAFDVELGTGLASLLRQAERVDAAIAVLETVAEAFPDSASVRGEMAELYLTAGRFESARGVLAALATSAAGEEAERYRDQVAWVERRLEVERNPVRVPAERLRAYAGEYGPRQVSLEDGSLHYRRDGNPSYRLLPLGDRMFQPVGLETFRIRFEVDDEGNAVRVMGHYFDGRTDENARTASEASQE